MPDGVHELEDEAASFVTFKSRKPRSVSNEESIVLRRTMKFGHTFSEIIEATHPSVSDKFLCYKTLKKCLKNIPVPPEREIAPVEPGQPRQLTDEECTFVKTLNQELKKFNEFFMNKEEELVMKESKLEDEFQQMTQLAARTSGGETTSTVAKTLCHAYAEFHGELVLLEHWVSINYTALVKILKKHDKRSSLALRSPFLVSVIQQPFYSTEVLSQLIAKAEQRFRSLDDSLSVQEEGHMHETGTANAASATTSAKLDGKRRAPGAAVARVVEAAGKEQSAADDSTLKRTKAALNCWRDLKDSESLLNPYGAPPGGVKRVRQE